MGSGKVPGWYPDPSGRADRFRWWDGDQWTDATSTSLWSPEPRRPQPYALVGRPTESSPMAGRHAAVPRVIDLDDLEETSRFRRPAVLAGIATASVLIVAAVVGVAVWATPRTDGQRPDGDERLAQIGERRPSGPPSTGWSPTTGPSLSPTTRPTPPHATRPATTPTATKPPAGGDPRPEPPRSTERPPAPKPRPKPKPPAPSTHVRFTAPGAWRSAGGGITRQNIPYDQAAVIDTEKAYDGKRNWQASMVAGDAPSAADTSGSLQTRAAHAARWYLRTEWNASLGGHEYHRVTIAGRPTGMISTSVSYNIPGLESKSDNLDVMIVDLGRGRPAGIVVVSVPENAGHLWRDVERAMNSTRLG